MTTRFEGMVQLEEAMRLLRRVVAMTTTEKNGHRVWRQVAAGKAKDWSAAMDDAATFLELHERYECPPQAHRYVDLNAPPDPELLVCRRCGKLQPDTLPRRLRKPQ